MKIQTRYFGELAIDESKKIVFERGIPGFETLKQFIIIEEEENPFCYLQSLEEGQVAFAIIDPSKVITTYNPIINEGYFEKLGGGKDEEFALYVIANVGASIDATTLNLQAPLLVHVERQLGVQAITDDKRYTTKHKIVDLLKEGK